MIPYPFLGHAIGLEHSHDENAMMLKAYEGPALDKKGKYIAPRLGTSDIDAARRFYCESKRN